MLGNHSLAPVGTSRNVRTHEARDTASPPPGSLSGHRIDIDFDSDAKADASSRHPGRSRPEPGYAQRRLCLRQVCAVAFGLGCIGTGIYAARTTPEASETYVIPIAFGVFGLTCSALDICREFGESHLRSLLRFPWVTGHKEEQPAR